MDRAKNKKLLENLVERRARLGAIGALNFLVEMYTRKHGPTIDKNKYADIDPITKLLLHNMSQLKMTNDEYNECIAFYERKKQQESEHADTKDVPQLPPEWPIGLKLAPLPESSNDFDWLKARQTRNGSNTINQPNGLSVVIPTFNRANLLDVTLACLTNQRTSYPIEIIITDDGSIDDLMPVVRRYENIIDLKYTRQPDKGYRLCAARNAGLRLAKYSCVAILDCDMAPNPHWAESYLHFLARSKDVALIGPRKYVDTSHIIATDILNEPDLIENLPDIQTNNDVSDNRKGLISVDWRITHFEETANLRLCDSPFRYFSGGNVAFWKDWIDIAGWFDEEFNHWGGEDNEFGYRLYRHGCFFRSVPGALAYHQEPPGKENETDRAGGQKITMPLVEEKVPFPYRKVPPIQSSVIKRIPLVSIYIPAYNCEETIIKSINSALAQTVPDLEVCICNDGSTDNTEYIIRTNFGDNPRVRLITQVNGGIGSASNTAVRMCRGYYIGQLDSDDYLEVDAVELCLEEFVKDKTLACVYTTNRNVYLDGSEHSAGYNWPTYSREKLTMAMICHHFRMFTARAWHLTDGFSEKISNAVDYDMYLKLSEVGPFKHVNRVSYNRVIHGKNTSILNKDEQKMNHFFAINQSLIRQGIHQWRAVPASQDISSRGVQFKPAECSGNE